jgi:hypothetical protein
MKEICPCCFSDNTRSTRVKVVCDDCGCIWWLFDRKPDPLAIEMVNAIADECHSDDCVCWLCSSAATYLKERKHV